MILIITALLFAILVAADLLTKGLICPALQADGPMSFIPGIFRFEYTENSGMAWGWLQGKTLILTIFTVIACALIVYFIIAKRKSMPALIRTALTLILAGAVGNLFDRIFLGYVRDFIVFDFWDTFPTFNFADACVTVGAVLLFVGLILTKKGREFFKSLDSDKKSDKKKKTETGAEAPENGTEAQREKEE